ncbi:MAG: hypothetical protein AAF299_19090 [Pseudomonadota bacterium]
MHNQSDITIASELDLHNMRSGADMPCHEVLDLRFTSAASARPVEEDVLLRLRNLHVGYAQLPVNLNQPDDRRKNDLSHRITERRGRMMIITDQPEAVNEFCTGIAGDTQGSARAPAHHQLHEAA